MDKIGLISENRNSFSDWAIDGLIYGLAGGVAMFLGLAIFTLFSGGSPATLLERLSTNFPCRTSMERLAPSATEAGKAGEYGKSSPLLGPSPL